MNDELRRFGEAMSAEMDRVRPLVEALERDVGAMTAGARRLAEFFGEKSDPAQATHVMMTLGELVRAFQTAKAAKERRERSRARK